MDIHSVALDPDQAIQVASGMCRRPRDRRRAAASDGSSTSRRRPNDSVDSPFLRTKLGYLTAELQVQYLPASGNSYLHLVLTWA